MDWVIVKNTIFPVMPLSWKYDFWTPLMKNLWNALNMRMWNKLDKVNEVKIGIVTFNRMIFVYFCLHLRPTIFLFCFLHSRPEGVYNHIHYFQQIFFFFFYHKGITNHLLPLDSCLVENMSDVEVNIMVY